MIWFNVGFIQIFFGNPHSPVSTISVQCRKLCVAQRIDTFIHACYSVRFTDCHCVQLGVVYAKEKSSVILRDDKNRWGPLRFRTVDSVHGQHSIDLLVFAYSSLRAGTTKSRIDGLGVRIVEFDSVLHRYNWPGLAMPHAFELLEHWRNFFAKRQVLIGYMSFFG